MRSKLEHNYSKIWEKYTEFSFQEVLSRGYAYHYDKDEKESDILFIGINPSFKKGSLTGSYSFDRNAPHPYFNPFRQFHDDLSEKIDCERYKKWTHIDILAIRETNQKFINTLIKKLEGVDFVNEQIELAKERMIYIQPKIIVVCNTKARELMGKNEFFNKKTKKQYDYGMNFNVEFDDEFGTYRITNVPELEHTHVLFSSMLSGQRALDLGSRERLVWQIGRVLKSNK